MKHLKLVITFWLMILALPVIANSSNDNYVENKDYTLLSTKVRANPEVKDLLNNNSNKVQLLLFFNYGCSACAKFEPSFDKWVAEQSNKNLVIYRFPVAFNDEWEELAKLYFVMNTLDTSAELNSKIFTAIHQHDQKLWQEDEMRDFFVSHGYSAEAFNSAYNSATVNSKVKQAQDLSTAYGINQTPTVIINGPASSYKLTVDQAGDNHSRFFKIVDYVTNKEEKTLKD